jgi:hypothetical protein
MEPWYASRGSSQVFHRLLVPWRDEHEWLEVCTDLVNSPATAIASTTWQQVHVWRARMALPPAIAVLVDATGSMEQLLQTCAAVAVEPGPPQCSRSQALQTQRLAAALALSRAVSMLTDRVQQRHKYAQSVGNLAKTLGIPALLVEVRHATVHQTLPSVAALVEAYSAWTDFVRTRYVETRKRSIASFESNLRALARMWYSTRPVPHHGEQGPMQQVAAPLLQAPGTADTDSTAAAFAEALLHPSAYVEVRWFAALVAQHMLEYARETSASDNALPSRERLEAWFRYLCPLHETWPHFLPSLVCALVMALRTTAVETEIATTDATGISGATHSPATPHATAVSPSVWRQSAAVLLVGLLETLRARLSQATSLEPWVIDHDCHWLEWLLHTQFAQENDVLRLYCERWIQQSRVGKRRQAPRERTSRTLKKTPALWHQTKRWRWRWCWWWQHSLRYRAAVSWKTGPSPRWEPQFGPLYGAWRRCVSWPTCPLGTLPVGYDAAAVQRGTSLGMCSADPATNTVFTAKENELAQRLVQRTLYLLDEYDQVEHQAGMSARADAST